MNRVELENLARDHGYPLAKSYLSRFYSSRYEVQLMQPDELVWVGITDSYYRINRQALGYLLSNYPASNLTKFFTLSKGTPRFYAESLGLPLPPANRWRVTNSEAIALKNAFRQDVEKYYLGNTLESLTDYLNDKGLEYSPEVVIDATVRERRERSVWFSIDRAPTFSGLKCVRAYNSAGDLEYQVSYYFTESGWQDKRLLEVGVCWCDVPEPDESLANGVKELTLKLTPAEASKVYQALIQCGASAVVLNQVAEAFPLVKRASLV